MIQKGVIISAYALDGKGVIPAVSKMAFGNKIGVSISGSIPGSDLFAPGFGDIIAEVPADKLDDISGLIQTNLKVTTDEDLKILEALL